MANNDDAPSTEYEDVDSIQGARDLGDREGALETEEGHESRLRRGIRDAVHFVESGSIRLFFLCVSLPIGVGLFLLIVSLSFQYATPWGWMSDNQLEDLLPAALAFKDAMAGVASGSAITAWLIYKRFQRPIDSDS